MIIEHFLATFLDSLRLISVWSEEGVFFLFGFVFSESMVFFETVVLLGVFSVEEYTILICFPRIS